MLMIPAPTEAFDTYNGYDPPPSLKKRRPPGKYDYLKGKGWIYRPGRYEVQVTVPSNESGHNPGLVERAFYYAFGESDYRGDDPAMRHILGSDPASKLEGAFLSGGNLLYRGDMGKEIYLKYRDVLLRFDVVGRSRTPEGRFKLDLRYSGGEIRQPEFGQEVFTGAMEEEERAKRGLSLIGRPIKASVVLERTGIRPPPAKRVLPLGFRI
ncbi:MAG: hypothetical protein JW727_04840 [Candidatus Aenigmarchaeota archaeon]|nr:hypothetical protein [Candidatus Aenigmarchaeota archaeon]